MAGVVGAHHTSFSVGDLDRSVKFFTDVLKFELIAKREIRDEYFRKIVGIRDCVCRAAVLRIPGSTHVLELFQYTHPRIMMYEPRPCDWGSSHLSLLVDDLDALYAEIQGKGASFVSPPVMIDAGPNAGALALYLRDPNGILVELFQPKK
jgi:catechol 2,3-dioxygenase-like lactoylglutathione lyase family enzyme